MPLREKQAQGLSAKALVRKKRKCGFLDLPGELRNIIYSYCFEDKFRAELLPSRILLLRHLHPCFLEHLTPSQKRSDIYNRGLDAPDSSTRTVRMRTKMGQYSRIKGQQTRWATSLCALVLVCQQVHAESIGLLYRNTTFVFHSSGRILNFLNTVSAANLSHITKLELHYIPYGEPLESSMAVYERKHLKSWDTACTNLAKGLVNLRELRISVQFPHSNYFSLKHNFLQPLFRFRARQMIHTGPLTSTDLQTSDVAGRLESVKVQVSTEQDLFPGPHRIDFVALELLGLFNLALSRFILGWSESDALVDLKRAFRSDDSAVRFLRYMNQTDLYGG